MGIKYLWDSNIVIYYLQQQFPPVAERFIDNVLKDGPPVISSITEIELLCWKGASLKDIEILHNFIDDALVIELKKPIKLKAAELRKLYKVKLPDAIIAATALICDLTLISRNIDDFTRIKELKLVDPYKK